VALPAASLRSGPTPPAFKPTPRPTPEEFRIFHVPVLMYHRVVPTSEAGNSISGLVVSPETFSAQMKALFDAGWHSITMATLADDMETDTTIPDKTFVITFDDGWYDGYVYAFPVMRKYGFVGTFYVITSRINAVDFLSTQELRTLEAAGNDIGNHTVDHVSLAGLSLSQATQEVENASEQIDKAIGHRPVSLAYPMGGITTAAAFVVSEIPDMKLAVTENPGNTETWFGRYDMPRVRVLPTTDPAQLLLYVTSK
jgi:peptidoglycan/xylan/chitin deacetylase (PgdA/CDA1 family)